jgi:(heptosyl)LPS beta-1,4-glucosyltransferase
MQITGAIITKNEESNIKDCILSLQNVCDEIIVLDSGSKDKTKSIVESSEATVIIEPWKGFEHAKNRLNQLANFPYVLNLDADERLSPELEKSILNIKKELKGSYSMNRLNNYCGTWIKYCGWYPDKKIRLFPKETEWKGGSLHEYPDVSQWPIAHLHGDILHYTYPTYKDHYNKLEEYASLAANNLKGKNRLLLCFKYWLSPIFKFLKMYFIKMGFLDGKNGYILCKTSAKGQKRKFEIALNAKSPA